MQQFIEQEKMYTSTGVKLLHHPKVISKIQMRRRGTPNSLQIAPTSRCNLNCVFCSNVNRDKHEDLEAARIERLLLDLVNHGVKTVEWTGGGDPLMYQDLDYVVSFASKLYLKQGLITNGLLLKDVRRVILDSFSWVRVSMNCLDYTTTVLLPERMNTLGFSYVWNEKTTPEVLARLREHVEIYHPKYVRMVPNCQSTRAEQEQNNMVLSGVVKKMGPPYFYQAKHFSKPDHCWWCYFKPFILHDGYVYPCSSVVLNDEADRQFHEKYRWCTIEELPAKYESEMLPYDPQHCSHCVFRPQNDTLDEIVNPKGMEDFI